MENSNEELFKSTGNITKQELYFLYGTDLKPADIILKFAEHKNFDAAKNEFEKWDQESVIIMSNYLNQSFRHEPELYTTRDKYIAMSFLKDLIAKWDLNQLPGESKHLSGSKEQELVKKRLSGVLPHIDLAGTDFTIDWRLRQLRETALPWKHINLEELETSESGEEYLCFFDTGTHEVYIPPADLTEIPADVVVLQIPYELKLDPVAVARDFGMGDTDLLEDNPILEALSAKVLPITESGLPDFVANNITRLSQSERTNPKRGR